MAPAYETKTLTYNSVIYNYCLSLQFFFSSFVQITFYCRIIQSYNVFTTCRRINKSLIVTVAWRANVHVNKNVYYRALSLSLFNSHTSNAPAFSFRLGSLDCTTICSACLVGEITQ